MTTAPSELETRDAELITTWVEANVGGRVHGIERQSRWRPVWFVDGEREGIPYALCVRGERVDIPGVWPLAP